MLMALGAAAGISDLLSSLQKSLPSGQPDGANPFSIAAGANSANTSSGSSSSASGAPSGTLSPNTWAALYATQSGAQGQVPQSPSDALKNLFSLVDSNSDGAISKSEFESNLGAGGTNLEAADSVFSQLDSNGDGSVSPDELSSALKGAGHRHGHHAQGAGSAEALLNSLGIDSSGADMSGASGTSGSTDPLLAALQGAQTTSASNSDGSTTTTITYADGTKVTMTTAAKPGSGSQATTFNLLEQMIQRQAKALSASASQAVSVTA